MLDRADDPVEEPGQRCGRREVGAAHGLSTTLTQPSSLFWKISYACGRLLERQVVRRERVDAQGVLVGQQREDVGHPALDVGLAHPQLDLLVEQRHHRHRVGHAAVHPAERDGAAATDELDRGVERGELVDAGRLEDGLRHGVGQQPGHRLGQLGRPASRARPDRRRRSPRPAPRPSVMLWTTSSRSSSCSPRSMTSTPRALARASRSGTRSTPMTLRPGLLCRAMRHAMSPIGPSPRTSSVPSAGHSAYVTACQAVGQHVGEVDEAVVRGTLGHLDVGELRLRHAEVLRLPAGHLPVELGVAEERGAAALVADLGGLALRVETAGAHPAVPARDLEREHDAVADLEVADLAADLLDDAHRLVAEDVTAVHERAERLVEVQVRPADVRAGDLDDRVGGLLDPWDREPPRPRPSACPAR